MPGLGYSPHMNLFITSQAPAAGVNGPPGVFPFGGGGVGSRYWLYRAEAGEGAAGSLRS